MVWGYILVSGNFAQDGLNNSVKRLRLGRLHLKQFQPREKRPRQPFPRIGQKTQEMAETSIGPSKMDP